MNEPVLVPHIKSGADARNIEPMRVFDRGLIAVVLRFMDSEDVITVIDELHAVEWHTR
jgi:hypothetical protein